LLNKTIRYQFGDKLRSVRERRGDTLKSVAEAAGVSPSLVSQIERNIVSPSLDTLMGLADVLDIDPDYLFKDFKKDKRVDIVRAGDRDSIVQTDVTYHQLSVVPEMSEKHDLEAFLLEIAPGKEKGDVAYGHPGKELGLLLEGEAELVYGTRSYELKAGDSISFSSDIPHILRNRGITTLKAVWVITPPRRLFARR
jgi:transcriptional regulator with XRE-family HTH domain